MWPFDCFFPLNKNLLHRRTATPYESRTAYCYNIDLLTFKRVNTNVLDDTVDDSHQNVLLKKNETSISLRSISRTIHTFEMYCKLFGKSFKNTLYILSARVYKITCIGCARRRKNWKTKYPCCRFAISVHAVATPRAVRRDDSFREIVMRK